MKNKEQELIAEAKKAIKFAYAPYSKFKVGCALLTKNGRIFTGCNIENASYGLTVCAERVALFKAISEGESELEKLVIYTPTNEFTYPCGACRQTLAEFNPNLEVILINKQNKLAQLKLSSLLPKPFTKEALK
ncbi:MAG: cytidine deaminase [candidate division WOR-3 bacterium]